MKYKTAKVYEFEELESVIKKKVIKEYHDVNLDTFYLIETDYLDDYFKELVENKGFDNPSFKWDLSDSQGSGLSFTASIDIDEFLKVHKLRTYFKPLMNKFENLCMSLQSNNSNYCYAETSYLKSNFDEYIDTTDKRFEKYNNLHKELTEIIYDEYLKICSEFEQIGYDSYGEFEKDKYIINEIDDNELLFYADGTIFHDVD